MMCSCNQPHGTELACNASHVVQFQAVRIALPGQFEGIQPYVPADLTLLQNADDFVLEGRYGYELTTGHEFVVTVDGQERTFDRWEDIPERIGRVRKFQPGAHPHDVDFVVSYRLNGQRHTFAQNVHHEPSGWVERLQQLVRREGSA